MDERRLMLCSLLFHLSKVRHLFLLLFLLCGNHDSQKPTGFLPHYAAAAEEMLYRSQVNYEQHS